MSRRAEVRILLFLFVIGALGLVTSIVTYGELPRLLYLRIFWPSFGLVSFVVLYTTIRMNTEARKNRR